MHLDPDKPLPDADADRFGYSETFLPRLLRVALDWPEKDGLVIGLYGSWGIGKTTILNMMKSAVALREKADQVTLPVVNFNPWFYEDSGALIAAFFATIAAVIGRDRQQPWATAAKSFKAVGRFLTVAAKGVSVFGMNVDGEQMKAAIQAGAESLAQTSDIAGSLAGMSELFDSGQEKLDEYRAHIKTALDKLGENEGRLLVMIDDVDRLNKDEMLSLLRLVRTVADLPYTSIIIAMDDERVREMLVAAGSEGYGHGYLDKIVQVPLHVPLPPKAKMREAFYGGLKRTFSVIHVELSDGLQPSRDSFRWSAFDLVLPLLQTPRDLARYLNALRTFLLAGAYDFDVDPVDSVLIEALHVFYPEIYDAVRRNKEFFTIGYINAEELIFHGTSENPERLRAERSARLDQLIRGRNSHPIRYEQWARDILRALFGDFSRQEWAVHPNELQAHRRIRSRVSFDDYFWYASNSDVLSKREVEELMVDVCGHAFDNSIEDIGTLLVDALAERSDEGLARFTSDFQYLIALADQTLLLSIGLGIVNTIGGISAPTSVALLGPVIERIQTRRESYNAGSGMDAETDIQQLVIGAFTAGLPVIEARELVEVTRRGGGLSSPAHTRVSQEWLSLFAAELHGGDLFNSVDHFEAAQCVSYAEELSREDSHSSILSLSDLQRGLVEYAMRIPGRFPNVLALAGWGDGAEFRLLQTPGGSRSGTLEKLNRIFGGVAALRPAYARFLSEPEVSPDCWALINDFEEILASVPE